MMMNMSQDGFANGGPDGPLYDLRPYGRGASGGGISGKKKEGEADQNNQNAL